MLAESEKCVMQEISTFPLIKHKAIAFLIGSV